MFGYTGKILRVDLSTGKTQEEEFDQEFARTFLGGNGFAAKLIYDGVPAGVDPLGKKNAIVFAVGPLAGTPVWGTSRGHVAAMSPQTGFFGDSNYGGNFAIAQKRSGFDAIYITGESSKPVYLLASENGAELKDAGDLWGVDTEKTINTLEAREGKGAVCACIGPAGENRVVFASIIFGGARTGAAGRCGMGSVMGSKNLKAIVAVGNKKTEVAQPDKLRAILKKQLNALKENTAKLTSHGTPMLVNFINERDLLGTHNSEMETCEFADDISADVLKENYFLKNIACAGCPVACGKKGKVPSGAYAGREVKLPEYETIYAMGSMLDNRDMVSIMNGNYACDLMGMDTISMGVTLSFVAECMEKGVVSEKDLGGRVDFADGDGMVKLIQDTAQREGIGDLLALGSEKLAERFGPEARKYLYTAKGLEIPGHSARGQRGLTLGYATGTRGGSHQDMRPKYPIPDEDPGFDDQPEINVRTQNYTAVGDSLVMCRFNEERGLGSQFNDCIADVVNYVTGWDVDPQELDTIGERIYNLERLVGVRQGLSRRNDTIPHRAMTDPIPGGSKKGRYCPREKLDEMLGEYYRLRGWTRDGIPKEEKLEELDLA